MYVRDEYVGSKFNKLLVLNVIPNFNARQTYFECLCDCGNYKFIRKYDVLSGKTKSCGCIRKQNISELGKMNKKPNLIENNGEYSLIKCNNGNVIIDTSDIYLISDKRVYIDNRGYVRIINKNTSILLHRFILSNNMTDFNNELYIDHINHNTLDNRKENLRQCTPAQNMMNRTRTQSNNKTGEKGVHFHKQNSKYVVYINFDGDRIHIGCFDDIESAIKSRREAELKYFGEYKNFKERL